MKINFYAFKAIYLHEMDRFRRTLTQSVLSPVLTTSLYFIVFGSVIGGYVEKIDGISYGSYICLLYTSPSPRDRTRSRMPSSA